MTNSDKLSLLAKRKRELEHAIRHQFAHGKIAKRIENVRSAALAVLKKYRSAFGHVAGAPGNLDWELQKEKWTALNEVQILEICESWPDEPHIQHVRIG